MVSGKSPLDRLIDQRDREILRAASPARGGRSVGSGGSPRRRWSPKSGSGGSPNRWSPTNWSPSRLSPTNKQNAYSELNEGDDSDVGFEVANENAVPVPTLNLTPNASPTRSRYPSPQNQRELPSPAAKARFSTPSLRQRERGLAVQPLSPSRQSPQHRAMSPAKQQSSPIFRFKLQPKESQRSGAIMPATQVKSSMEDTRDEFDDFDILVKERVGSTKDSSLEMDTPVFNATTLPSPPGIQSARHLHELCATIGTLDDLLRAQTFLKGHRDYASRVDMQGRTPLHIFSNNKVLAAAIGVPNASDYFETHEFLRIHEQPTNDPETSQLEKHVLRFLIGDLLTAHPGAMMIRDDQGNIPFKKMLVEWVEESHQRGISNDAGATTTNPNGFSYTSAVSNVWESTMKMAGRTSQFVAGGFAAATESPTRVAHEMERGDSRHAIFSPDRREQFAGINAHGKGSLDPKGGAFPANVRLSPQARFALIMLSAALDQLERYLSPELLRRNKARPDATGESFVKAHDDIKNFQKQFGSVNIVASVVETFASVPDLMNTILLVDDDSDREFALSTSVVRRIMLSKNSVGPWLTKILQCRDRRLAQRAVDYLKIVSDEIAKQKADGPKSSKHDEYSKREEYLVDEFSRLQDFVPSLLALNERGIEDASTTSIVKQVMGRMISRPFAVTVIICDALFLAILIIGFRYAVNRLIGGAPLEEVLQWIYVANTGIFYFVIREIGKTVSLFLISTRARTYFLSFWNLIDALTVMLALASTILMRSYFGILENGMDDTAFLRGLLAITTGFLWLRVLSLLKAINIQLATFVLAILQITKDIIWFCVILATLVVSFAQMFFTLLAPPSCADGSGSDMVCQPTEYLLRTYTVLLGDFGTFERVNFTTGFSVFLVVCYSFLVTVVLMNVLIAVASDSYEKCLLRSQHLFGRARVMLIAELVAFQNLLQTTDHNESPSSKSTQGIYSPWRSSSRWIRRWSRASILFFSLSVMVIIAWTLAEFLGYAKGEGQGNIVFSLASVIVNVVLFAVIMCFLAAASAGRDSKDSKQERRGWVRGTMLRLLGVSSDPDATGRTKDVVDEWNGRVFHLEREMRRIADHQKTLSSQQARTMENLVSQAESRLKAELESLEDNLIMLREGLLQEVKGTKRTNQYVTFAVQELKQLLISSSSTNPTPVPSEVNLDRTRTIPLDLRDL